MVKAGSYCCEISAPLCSSKQKPPPWRPQINVMQLVLRGLSSYTIAIGDDNVAVLSVHRHFEALDPQNNVKVWDNGAFGIHDIAGLPITARHWFNKGLNKLFQFDDAPQGVGVKAEYGKLSLTKGCGSVAFMQRYPTAQERLMRDTSLFASKAHQHSSLRDVNAGN